LDPNNATLNYFRGMLHFTNGEYRQAFEDFDASILKDDRFAIGYFYRGRMEVVFENWAAAEREFSAAIERDPDFDSAFHWRAIANAKLGRHAQAAQDAERAMSLDPDDRLTHFYAARAYAGAAGAVTSDTSGGLSSEEAGPRYAQRAVEILARAIELGFEDFTRIVPGGDFTPLYDRDDFLELANQAVARKIAEREPRLQEDASDGENRLALAELYLAHVEIRTGRAVPQEADLTALARSLELFTQLLKEEKQRSSAARLISRVVQRQGELLDRLQRDAEADKVWERVAMLEGPQQRHAVVIDRAFNLARWNDHARAASLLQPLREIADLPPGDCYNAACVLAIAAAKAQADQGLPEDERTSKAQQSAGQAMQFLERARDAGYFEDPAVLEHAKRDADLDFLRDRPDFQALLTSPRESSPSLPEARNKSGR
jgi:tetratricopeptide (TPR) repeat protein